MTTYENEYENKAKKPLVPTIAETLDMVTQIIEFGRDDIIARDMMRQIFVDEYDMDRTIAKTWTETRENKFDF
jgi:hypothetical protein